MEEDFAQLYRDSKDGRLKTVVNNEEVVPLETFRAGILRVNPDAPVEQKRNLLKHMFHTRNGANAFEIGDGRTVTSFLHEEGYFRDYAVGFYRLYDKKVENTLDSEKRDELELGGNWF